MGSKVTSDIHCPVGWRSKWALLQRRWSIPDKIWRKEMKDAEKKKHEYQQTINMGKNKSFHKNDLWGIYILYMYILHIYIYIYIPSCESSGEFLLPSFHCNWYEWLEPIAIMASLRWWSRNSPKSKVKFSNVLREKPWLHFPEGQLGQDSCHVAHLRCKISGYTKSPIENHSFVNGVSWFP